MLKTLTLSSVFRKQFPTLLWLLALCAAAVAASGCSARRRPALVWSAAVRVRPIIPPRGAMGAGEIDEPTLDWSLEIPPPLPRGVHSGPARPRVPSGQQAGNGGGDAEGPLISPQLTATEIAAAKSETQQSLGVAEHNLAFARGRSLNPAQADLASKVRGFLDDAREAVHHGDWTHAQSLAKKAEVLSHELAKSF
jgi:hypothetical protein